MADRSRNRRPEEERPREELTGPGRADTRMRAIAILEEILKYTPQNDPRMGLFELLYEQLRADERQLQEARETIRQFNETYEKLTSPANRIGTFLGNPQDQIAYIAVGDAEYYANADPKLDLKKLHIGTRVKINEAFAVIGDLGYHPEGPVVKVSEVLPDGRLRISMDAQMLSSRIVLRSSDLMNKPLKVGDEVRLEPTMRVALEHFQKAETRGYFLEQIPEIPWEKIGGQAEAIKVIRDAIERPLLYPELYKKFGKRHLKGLLLYGPPGCGKTLIGKATAYNLTKAYRERTGRDVKEYFMLINGPQLLNMWLGETERFVREIFATARERAKEGHLVFIFIDEADALLRVRSSGRHLNIANTVVPQFAAEMDGLVSLENVVVMLTSNRPDYIDPAILRPERIERKVKVGRPNREAARDIFAIYLDEKVPLDPGWLERHGGDPERARRALIEEITDDLFRRESDTAFLEVALRSGRRETLYRSDLVSGALIKSVVERAKGFAIERCIERGSDREGVSLDDLKEAIRQEYKESEIFPKTDYLEDWLKLLDYEPEEVVEVRPVREREVRRVGETVV
ncbi:MAG: AAA family ATPase [Candidatus Bipolaricaulota bacterium]|nr:AAA family ATPase [Candidatus Bipolaricaulota bacterium]MCS7274300.1 AAA family ATPase [Candidatus Bipolaricaulota bacterium]MDW8111449.1 AAA family ATPase [Candidatus Bipolaricaulota bacterium]MDW8329408.1 AAA family ATPase [Candidatus Bipolaricaulota bacterium]